MFAVEGELEGSLSRVEWWPFVVDNIVWGVGEGLLQVVSIRWVDSAHRVPNPWVSSHRSSPFEESLLSG